MPPPESETKGMKERPCSAQPAATYLKISLVDMIRVRQSRQPADEAWVDEPSIDAPVPACGVAAVRVRDAVCIEQPSISLRAELTAYGSVSFKHLLIRVRLRAIAFVEVEVAKPYCTPIWVARVGLWDVGEQVRKVPFSVAISASGGVREHDQQR